MYSYSEAWLAGASTTVKARGISRQKCKGEKHFILSSYRSV
uniref:Uncharacterized protein n=1 Tax=Anguilla anguilla TaxID=7936 RepID=A0A0E9UR75_ANGAN